MGNLDFNKRNLGYSRLGTKQKGKYIKGKINQLAISIAAKN